VRNENQKQLHHNHHHHIHLPTKIPFKFGRAKSSDGTAPDKLLSANINASRRREKKAKMDVEDGFQPCSSKHKSTLRPYLHKCITSTLVRSPSSDGIVPLRSLNTMMYKKM